MSVDLKSMKALEAIFRAGLEAVDPGHAVRRNLKRDGDTLHIANQDYPLSDYSRVFVVGAGKGTAPMASAVEEILGDRLEGGIIVVKYDHGLPLERVRVVEAGHPIPDRAGMEGTMAMLELLRQCGPEDLVICLFSGGGSALLPAPISLLTLQQKQDVTELLLHSGASIDEINCLRKHLSLSKGGRLAQAAYPARIISLILSDVVGDHLDVIASGPTVPDRSSFSDVEAIVEKYGLLDRLPEQVRSILTEGAAGKREDTPKPGAAFFSRVQNQIIGNNRMALLAAQKCTQTMGYQTLILSSCIEGEAREVARTLAAIGKEVLMSGHPIAAPACILAGGETTVTLRGSGKGGRNQELALAAALALTGWKKVTLLSAGTDGTDGPTDAAGAFVDGTTVDRALKKGLKASRYLEQNDAYSFFKGIDDLFITGPTRTNVMDMICLLVDQ